MFLGLLDPDPDPDPLVRGMDPNPDPDPDLDPSNISPASNEIFFSRILVSFFSIFPP